MVSVIQDLNDLRVKIEDVLIDQRKSTFEKEEEVFQSIKMLDLMAECMILLEEKDTAIQIWEMIFEANKIFTAMDKI